MNWVRLGERGRRDRKGFVRSSRWLDVHNGLRVAQLNINCSFDHLGYLMRQHQRSSTRRSQPDFNVGTIAHIAGSENYVPGTTPSTDSTRLRNRSDKSGGTSSINARTAREASFHTERKAITATARAAKASMRPTSQAGKGKRLLTATMPRPIRTAIDPSMSLAK